MARTDSHTELCSAREVVVRPRTNSLRQPAVIRLPPTATDDRFTAPH